MSKQRANKQRTYSEDTPPEERTIHQRSLLALPSEQACFLVTKDNEGNQRMHSEPFRLRMRDFEVARRIRTPSASWMTRGPFASEPAGASMPGRSSWGTLSRAT